MIRYKYSLLKDIKNALWTIGDREWFKEHSSITVFWPNPLRWIWFLLWFIFAKKPTIQTENDIICYIVSSGTWGAYHPDEMAISICPWKISESPDKNMEGIIRHEITHLEHPEADSWEHYEKENYIEKLTTQKD